MPCQHDGVCEDHVNGYNCTCPDGYIGKRLIYKGVGKIIAAYSPVEATPDTLRVQLGLKNYFLPHRNELLFQESLCHACNIVVIISVAAILCCRSSLPESFGFA